MSWPQKLLYNQQVMKTVAELCWGAHEGRLAAYLGHKPKWRPGGHSLLPHTFIWVEFSGHIVTHLMPCYLWSSHGCIYPYGLTAHHLTAQRHVLRFVQGILHHSGTLSLWNDTHSYISSAQCCQSEWLEWLPAALCVMISICNLLELGSKT